MPVMNNKASQKQLSPVGRRRGSEVVQDTESGSTAIDGKEKKRMQNRMAQRAYRHRLKKRIEDLELQVHEQNSSDGTNHSCGIDEDIIHSSNRGHKRILSKISTDKSPEKQLVPQRFVRQINSRTSTEENSNRPDLHSRALPRLSETVLPVNPAIDSRARQQRRPSSVCQSLSQELGTSSGHLDMAQEVPESMLNSATMPQELIAPYLGGYPQHPNDSFLPQWSVDKDLDFLMIDEPPSVAPTLDSKTAKSEQMQLEANPQYHRTEVEPQAWAVLSSNNSTNSESPAQSCSSISSKKASLSSTPSQSIPSTLSFIEEDNDDRLHPPDPTASIEKRIEYVLSCAQQAGFDSLDLLITAYYGRELKQSSTLSVEQRMSRHRRLPQLLAELRQGSANWSAWERNGYEDEILRAAEDICGAEYSQFIRGGSSAVEKSLVGDLEGNGMSIPQRSFQDELPHLWALLTSLTSASMSMSHRDRSNVVFASMLLPCYWGRARSDQIMSWLQTCLESSSLSSNNAT